MSSMTEAGMAKKVKLDEPALHGEVHNPSDLCRSGSLISSMAQYREMYERSLRDPDNFWREVSPDVFTVFLCQTSS